MSSFESQPYKQTSKVNQPPLPISGRESMEVRRKFAQQEVAELLALLSEKLGKAVQLEYLSEEFGEAGANVEQYFQEIMAGQVEYNLIASQARLFKAKNILINQIEEKH